MRSSVGSDTEKDPRPARTAVGRPGISYVAATFIVTGSTRRSVRGDPLPTMIQTPPSPTPMDASGSGICPPRSAVVTTPVTASIRASPGPRQVAVHAAPNPESSASHESPGIVTESTNSPVAWSNRQIPLPMPETNAYSPASTMKSGLGRASILVAAVLSRSIGCGRASVGFGLLTVAGVVGAGGGGVAEAGAVVAAGGAGGAAVPANCPALPGPVEHAATITISSMRQLARRTFTRRFSLSDARLIRPSLPLTD